MENDTKTLPVDFQAAIAQEIAQRPRGVLKLMKQALQTRFQHVGWFNPKFHVGINMLDQFKKDPKSHEWSKNDPKKPWVSALKIIYFRQSTHESGCPIGAQLVPWVPCASSWGQKKRAPGNTWETSNGKTAQKRRMKKNLYILSINMDLEDESGTIPEFSRGENYHPETSASRSYSWVCREVTTTAWNSSSWCVPLVTS